MGYGTKLFIGPRNGERSYVNAEVEAIDAFVTVDLGKVGAHDALGLASADDGLRYVAWPAGGESEVSIDEYGSYLSVGTRDVVLAALEERRKTGRVDFVGVDAAVAVLRVLTPELVPDLIVLGYGY